MARLRAHLARHKAYPRRARARRIEGTVTVGFTVHRDGRITDTRIAEGSGADILDRAARELLRQANPAPAFPQDLPAESITLTVPVRYGLR
jgi:protein TonB